MNSVGDPEERVASWLPIALIFQFVFVVSYIDRQLLTIVVEPIKRDLRLSDTQIGLLQGFAFYLILVFAGLMTARLVDRGNRVRVLGCCIIAWCVMTIACGFATNFYFLLFTRSGLAIAESAVPIASLSILADRVPKRILPIAGALFMAGSYLGGGLAWLIGGPLLAALEPWRGLPFPVIGAFEPWRAVFWCMGVPGILLGIAILVAMPEPPRKGVSTFGIQTLEPIGPYLRHHWRFLVPLATLLSGLNFVNMTVYAWTPSLMIRVYHMDAAAASVLIGPLFVCCGLLGCLFGGWIMAGKDPDRLVEHIVRRMVILAAFLTPPLLSMPFAPSMWFALAGLGLGFFLLSSVLTSCLMPIQLHTPGAMRGRATAIFTVCTSGFGGLGPLLAGAAADNLFPAPRDFAFAFALAFAAGLAIALSGGILVWRRLKSIGSALPVQLPSNGSKERDNHALSTR